jgi:hypothetical protein
VPQDTSPEQLERHAALLRAMTPGQRANALRAVDRGVRRMAMISLRHRFPDASERELVIRHVAAVHGVEVARRVYGQLPADLLP